MPTVLIIDDENQARKYLARLLEKQGFDVIEAPDGLIGEKLYKDNPTDLVITDIIMPGKEGLELIRDLKSDHPDVKIIAMSGGCRNGPLAYLSLAKQIGADNCLQKPFTKEELMHAILDVLDLPIQYSVRNRDIIDHQVNP